MRICRVHLGYTEPKMAAFSVDGLKLESIVPLQRALCMKAEPASPVATTHHALYRSNKRAKVT